MVQNSKIKGSVEHIVYRNPENGYTVLALSCDGEELTAVGSLPELGEGELIEAEGAFTVHGTYGRQFRIQSCEIVPPESARNIERYLGSGIIKGIRQSLAHSIVSKFGDDTFRIIEEEPERLARIKGISVKKAKEIASQVYEKRDQRDVLLFLSAYGISNSLAIRLYKRYGRDIYSIIKENPYKLADDISGIGFRTADEIARRSGLLVDSHFRISGGILYILQLASGEGNIYLPKEILKRRTAALLGIKSGSISSGDFRDYPDPWENDAGYEDIPFFDNNQYEPDFDFSSENSADPIEECLDNLAMERRIVMKAEDGEIRVYEEGSYSTELKCAQLLSDLNIESSSEKERVAACIRKSEKKARMQLDERQLKAVMEAERRGLLILTGGPGTGKTTTINTMISVFEEEGLSIALAAPTGRAAKRMTEATGREAKTIHRLLEVSGDPESGLSFGRNEDEPLEEDVIIVDEMSMVDIYLMHSLLKAVPTGTHLIMAGDANQLPSVGPGAVLKDMIESGTIPVVTLKTIFRQASESDIVVNAHKINGGIHPVLSNQSKDFFFMRENDPNKIIGLAIKLVSDNLPRYVDASSADIQVMTPMKKGNLGVLRLNKLMQQYLNKADPGKKEYQRGETVFREGDRVMQIKNNYQKSWETRGRHGALINSGEGVFNGDMGIIRTINDYSHIMTVEFDEHRFVEYETNDLEQLELAYAVTIHKAQGSEYPAVVIPLLKGPSMLMNRNLLYTAVTRARKCVVLIGDPEVMNEMIDNVSEASRYTSLAKRLREAAILSGGMDSDHTALP